MDKRLSDQSLGRAMRKFLLIVIFFLLSGCEDHCIKPENLLNLRENWM